PRGVIAGGLERLRDKFIAIPAEIRALGVLDRDLVVLRANCCSRRCQENRQGPRECVTAVLHIPSDSAKSGSNRTPIAIILLQTRLRPESFRNKIGLYHQGG